MRNIREVLQLPQRHQPRHVQLQEPRIDPAQRLENLAAISSRQPDAVAGDQGNLRGPRYYR